MHCYHGLRSIVTTVFLVLCAGMLMLSCDFFTEPAPFSNTEARPPQSKHYARINLQPGATVTGGFFLEFVPDEGGSQIKNIQFFIDSTLMTDATSRPNEYFVDTKGFGVGSHNLSFVVFLKNPDQGLLNPFHLPSVTYSTTLVFADLPLPPRPENIVLHWIYLGHPRITWDYPSGADSLVDYFVIARTFPTRLTDTVFSHSHVFTDSSLVDDSGNNQFYFVGAGNALGINYAAEARFVAGKSNDVPSYAGRR